MAIDGKAVADVYDEEARAVGWLGPEIAFGMAYAYVTPGQTILDLGIGTGLTAALFHKAGLTVLGMDVADDMLNACRSRGVAAALTQHDLRTTPYPYEVSSVDHVVCVGVLNFLLDPSPVFDEVSRILRDGGVFVLVVADRHPGEEVKVPVSEPDVVFRLLSEAQIRAWLAGSGLYLVQTLEFTTFQDRARSARLPVRAYLARKPRH